MDALEKSDITNIHVGNEKQKYEVNNLKSATWVMRRLKAFDQQDKEIVETAKDQIADIQNWRDKELERNQGSREYMQGLLSDYLMELRKEDPKARISTPYGTVSTRKSPAGVIWPSDQQLTEKLTQQGLNDYIRVKEEPDKKQIKKDFTFINGHFVNPETGVILDGPTPKESIVKTNFDIKD